MDTDKVREKNIASRAASRLQQLLTDTGYQHDPIGRASSLAKKLNRSQREAEALLSGIIPWSLIDVATLCEAFGKSAGYFLDPGPTLQIPTDTELVIAGDGGESTVWRAPPGLLNAPRCSPPAPLRYLSATAADLFGVQRAKAMHIYEDWSDASRQWPRPSVDRAYVVEDGGGMLQTMLCRSVGDHSGVFDVYEAHRSGPLSTVQVGCDKVVGHVIGAIHGY
jgi:hypothetical protein